MKSMQMRKKQSGFTIIELVVVILLLGILTATALPRFLDLATEAHDAVLDGVEAGLRTGVALYHAQWNGQGRPPEGTQITQYGSLRVNSAGFPGGEGCDNGAPNGTTCDSDLQTDGTFDESDTTAVHTECSAIFSGLLQAGHPSIAGTGTAIAALTQAEVDAATTDFVAKLTAAGGTGTAVCSFAYLGDSARTTQGSLEGFTYTPSTGAIDRVDDL